METNEEFAKFVELIPFPAWLTDPSGTLVYANQAMLKRLDSTQIQIAGLHWLSFVQPPERARLETFWQARLESKSVGRTNVNLPYSVDHADIVELTCFYPKTDNVEHVWVFAAHDTVKLTHDYEATVEDLRATLNFVPAHTWYANAQGALTWVNDRLADFLGLPEDYHLRRGIDVDADWQSHLIFVHPEDRAESIEIWEACLRTSMPNEVRFRVAAVTGEYRLFLSRVEPLRNKDGTLLYWIGINLDIDDEKRRSGNPECNQREVIAFHADRHGRRAFSIYCSRNCSTSLRDRFKFPSNIEVVGCRPARYTDGQTIS